MMVAGLAFALATTLGVGEPVTGQPATVALQWSAPTGCADASIARADLERLTGGAIVVGEGANLP